MSLNILLTTYVIIKHGVQIYAQYYDTQQWTCIMERP